MSPAFGPYLAAAALLVGAGVAKARRPDDTARAVRQLTGRASLAAVSALVRCLAVAEALLGAAALAHPDPFSAALVGASYLGFTGFVLWARARGGALATCGCFGTPDTPPTIGHAALDAGFALSAALVALRGRGGWLPAALAHQYGHGVPLVIAAAACAWLSVLVMSSLGRLGALRRAAASASGAAR